MSTRTTTIRVPGAQLRVMELFAESLEVSLADFQRDAFSAYIEALAVDNEELLALRGKVAEEWKSEDDARGQEARQQALGKSVT